MFIFGVDLFEIRLFVVPRYDLCRKKLAQWTKKWSKCLLVKEENLIKWDGSLFEKLENIFRKKVEKNQLENLSESECQIEKEKDFELRKKYLGKCYDGRKNDKNRNKRLKRQE